MRNCIALFILLIFCETGFSQTLSGKVINADTKEPLAAASVYLSNTSFGSYTNQQGVFNLSVAGGGKYNLIVSFVGYETFVRSVNFNTALEELIIPLKPKQNKLEDVVLEPVVTNGWQKWGKFFTDLFIGTSSYSWDCTLKNPEVIKFINSKKEKKLKAFASEPLIIKNNSLGYEIRYSLEEFEFDFVKKIVRFNGYPLFKDLSRQHPSKAIKWQGKRKIIYNGSLMHFMRAIFANKLEEEGYEMRSLASYPNVLKFRARELFKRNKDTTSIHIVDSFFRTAHGDIVKTTIKEDSTEIYRKALLQPDTLISYQLISADSIGFAIDKTTAGMYCKDSIEVKYLLKEVPDEYKRLTGMHKNEKFPVSQFTFINKQPIEIFSTGNYYGPNDLLITGYWAWWETMSTMLPFDYLPKKLK